MVAMSASVTLKGNVKISLKKMLAGGEMTQSTFTGPGEVLLAPPALGDIVPIRLDGQQTWSVGKDGFLACTQGVVKDYKSQGFGKALFSGEGLFVYKMSGTGVLFITSLGAIIQKNVSCPILGHPKGRKVTKLMVVTDGAERAIYCRQQPSRRVELQV